ncbi:MAG TPA: hypothetical protein VFR62_14730, partial [Gemmatimonadales bacterium]|nr:hypothetical protein [Gemmatimonadales bacterium]
MSRTLTRALLCAVLSLGCGEGPVLTDRIGIVGLWVDPNAGKAPVGALLRADEVALPIAGVVRPVRGLPRLAQFGDSDSRAATAGLFLDAPILAYVNGADQVLAYYDGTWKNVPYIWGVSPLVLGTRTQLAVVGQSLYLTSAYGVQMVDRLDSTAITAGEGDWGVQRAAGLGRPLDPRATIAGTSGILAANTATAYRTVMGFTDANGRVHLSAPSQRLIVINPPAFTVAIGGLVRTGGTTVTGTTTTAHGLTVGQTVALSPGEANFAAGNKTIASVPTPTTFTYAEAGLNAASTAQQTFTPTAGNVSLTQKIPATDTAGGPLVAGYWFTQFHRSQIAASASTDPGDDLKLVYEH